MFRHYQQEEIFYIWGDCIQDSILKDLGAVAAKRLPSAQWRQPLRAELSVQPHRGATDDARIGAIVGGEERLPSHPLPFTPHL